MNKLYITLAFLLFSTAIWAQEEKDKELSKQVNVIREFEPSISDAFKINELPKLVDTIKINPSFDYFLNKYPISTSYDVTPIKPARMVGEPKPILDRGYIKLGVGNHLTALADGYYNNLRSADKSFGVLFNHYSASGDIKLDNNQELEAGSSHTRLQLYGKKMFDNAILKTDLGLKNRGIKYYGYRTDTLINSEDLPGKQNYLVFDMHTRLNSTYKDSSKMNYHAAANIAHLQDKFSNTELNIEVGGRIDKYLDGENLGVELNINHFNKSASLDTANNTLVRIAPFLSKFGDKWRVTGGVALYSDIIDDYSETFFYPIGNLQFDIVSHFIIPFAGVSGGREANNYYKIIRENPYVKPGISVKNTDRKFVLFGGLKGNMSKNISYYFKASYSIVDYMYFYVNDFSDRAGSQFDVVYDNIELKDYYGELIFKSLNRMKLHLKAAYFDYKMTDEAKPWHLPQWKTTTALNYILKSRITIKADVFAEGGMYARDIDNNEILIDNLIDANLGVEYQYSKFLSGFIQFNNVMATSNYYRQYYPSYGFTALLGITYTF